MDAAPCLTRPGEVRAYLADIGFIPSKSLGQNFLIDAHIRDLMLDAAEIVPGDRVVEIGPGLGVMTEGLLQRGADVTAIELDFRLSEHLRRRFSDVRNLQVIQADALKSDWAALLRPDPVRVISNLPYSVGSRILYDLANPALAPLTLTVMLQRDVADRLLASPGGGDYGLLTVRMRWMFDIRRVHNVPGSCFLPPPRVGSTVAHLRRHPAPPLPLRDPENFERLIRFAFTRRRKQLAGILREFAPHAPPPPLDSARRPETLEPAEWAMLSNHLSEHSPPSSAAAS
jgi:16S rRNA (adenine1518-N6/adenine1519-N6)-dimethyltransferase